MKKMTLPLLLFIMVEMSFAAVSNEVLLQEIRSNNKRLDMLQKNMDKRFEQMDKRFEQMDKRFDMMSRSIEILREDMNKRFEQVEKRFDQVDKRFDMMNRIIDNSRADTDKRLEQIDKRIDFTHTILYGVAVFVSSTFFLGIILQDRRSKKFEQFLVQQEQWHKQAMEKQEKEYKAYLKTKEENYKKELSQLRTMREGWQALINFFKKRATTDKELAQELRFAGIM